ARGGEPGLQRNQRRFLPLGALVAIRRGLFRDRLWRGASIETGGCHAESGTALGGFGAEAPVEMRRSTLRCELELWRCHFRTRLDRYVVDNKGSAIRLS